VRKLASIQRIEKIESIEGADFILKATVLGWDLVVRKDENFKPGDLGVYCEIDSLLPDIPEFQFLKSASGKVPEQGFVHRLKTKKLKGVISQGLLIPLSAFSSHQRWNLSNKKIGDDVTDLLGIKKYEPPVHMSLNAGSPAGEWPSFIPKTDETRIQSIPEVIDEVQGKPVYITVKYDGTSATYFYKDGRFGVCSRTLERRKPIPEPAWRTKLVRLASKFGVLDFFRKYGLLRHWKWGPPAGKVVKNPYWELAERYDLENKLKALGRNIAIQGEICGPVIQKNRLGLKDLELFVFDVWDINNQKFLNYYEQCAIANSLSLERVEDIGVFDFNWKSVEEVLKLAEGKYASGCNREGIVIRTLEPLERTERKRISFKAVNNQYLLHEEE
jgi:RNA ligase (TIGR02306 family)